MKTVSIRKHRNKNDYGNGIFRNQTWNSFFMDSVGKEVVLYGAGVACEQFLSEHGNRIKANTILDSDGKRAGKYIRGLEIKSVEWIKNYDFDKTIFLITSVEHDDEIGEYLEECGAKYIYSVYAIVSKEYKGLFKQIRDFFFEYHYGLFSNHNLLYNYLIFPVMAFFRIVHFPPAYLPYKDLEQYRGLHKGKRCFVVATGPSLRKDDLERLRLNQEICFSMNSIMNLYDEVQWRPDYYVIEDPKFLDFFDWNDPQYDLDNVCTEASFLTYMYREKCRKFSKVHFYPISFLNHLHDEEAKDLRYSDNIIWGYYCAYTVTTICMQIAHYMGFSEIYLLGTDCNYSRPEKHFSKERDDFIYTEDRAKRIHDNLLRGYAFIGSNIMKDGTRIYNATRGGELEVFERVDFDEVLGK
ncbi:MAG: DUF115 domain-containing protein [Butyrivibrio sp.]|jgi:hypothetical protein|nr:DUF115 domain-containing protein [Butyrivibrio sp.]